MSNQDLLEQQVSNFKKGKIKNNKGISIVWLLPIVALLIAIWLGYKAYSEKGVNVTISFKEAEGLEAGKTKIKYKDIEFGTVTNITLSNNLNEVLVTANFNNDAKKHLNENTRFWIARPRIGASGISGLNTLFSGVYIQIEPGDGINKKHFVGLDEPPVVASNVEGRKFVLHTDNLGSLHAGAPIYHRGIHAGEILDYEFTPGSDQIKLNIFVEAPFHKQVRENTRFWDVSGIEMQAGADGFDIKTGTLQSLLAGGIAFDSFGDKTLKTNIAKSESIFKLYSRYSQTSEQVFDKKISYVMFFSGSVRGLSVGAPVEFRGIKLGEVIDVKIVENPKTLEIYIPVTIELEPERIPDLNGNHISKSVDEVINELVARGLKGQLQTGSLLTGQLYIDLEFHPAIETKLTGIEYHHPELPTIPSTFSEIKETIAHLATDIQSLPLNDIAQNILETTQGLNSFVNDTGLDKVVHSTNETLQGLESLVNDPELKEIIHSTHATLDEAKHTLTTLDDAIAPDSKIRYELANTITEFRLAARSIRVLTDYLERHPEALLAGKK